MSAGGLLMKRCVMAAFAVLAGCVTNNELIATGEWHERVLLRSPELATTCMWRNLDANRFRFGNITLNGTIRPMTEGGSELIVATVLVAQAKREGTGSRVTIWLARRRFAGRSAIVTTMTNGC
jgi:hypothetical protein